MLPNEQLRLIGYKDVFGELLKIHKENKMPSKILFSGKKGIGKSIFAHHFVNYVFSYDETYAYDINKNEIDPKNRSLIFVQKNIHPNFFYINKKKDKKNIEISQIRELDAFINKSSFNNKLKIIIIDDLQSISINASNALLKLIEEPNNNLLYLLVHDNSKYILETLKSRCIEFKLKLNWNNTVEVVNNYFQKNIINELHSDFNNIYLTPLNLINLINVCQLLEIDTREASSKKLVEKIIDQSFYNKYDNFYDDIKLYIEIFFRNQLSTIKSKEIFKSISQLNNKYSDAMRFNLDIEPIFIELKLMLLNEK